MTFDFVANLTEVCEGNGPVLACLLLVDSAIGRTVEIGVLINDDTTSKIKHLNSNAVDQTYLAHMRPSLKVCPSIPEMI